MDRGAAARCASARSVVAQRPSGDGPNSAAAAAPKTEGAVATASAEPADGSVAGEGGAHPVQSAGGEQPDAVVGAQRQEASRLRLYQILAPELAGRGVVFGNKLAFRDAWQCVDSPYFAAPGGCFCCLCVCVGRRGRL